VSDDAPPMDAAEAAPAGQPSAARPAATAGAAASLAGPSRTLKAIAFVAGACVMAVEMGASRLLAPAFGTSILVWANLIGVILLAMAVGYNVGGRLADRHPAVRGLFLSLGGAGALIALLPLAGRAALDALAAGITGTPITVILISFFAVILLVAPPVFLLAFATPFAIRLGSPDVAHTGRVAGTLGTWSTAGSLVGTFIPALVTIPTFGTRATLLGIAGVLIVTAAIGLGSRRGLILLLIPAAIAVATRGPTRAAQGLLYEKESPYQFVEVVRNNGMTQLIVNEGGGVQSAWRQGSELTGMYYDAYMLLPFLQNLQQPGRSLLVLGSGGGTILRQYHDVLSSRFDLTLRGVEIDPVVAATGPRFFGLSPRLYADERIADARPYLAASHAHYDLIVVDAYAQQLYIPFQLTTTQFFHLAAAHLAPGGVVAMNVNAVDEKSPLLNAILHTLHSALPHTYIAHLPGAFNYLLVGSETPLDGARLRSFAVPGLLRPLGAEVAAAWQADAAPGGMLLTDDRAPVEFLTDWELWRGIQRYGP
jgi:spermidine synthase